MVVTEIVQLMFGHKLVNRHPVMKKRHRLTLESHTIYGTQIKLFRTSTPKLAGGVAGNLKLNFASSLKLHSTVYNI